MISIQTAILIAALSALITGAIVWGKTAQKIEDLCKLVEKMSEKMSALVLDVERLKWHTGQTGPFRAQSNPGTPHAPEEG